MALQVTKGFTEYAGWQPHQPRTGWLRTLKPTNKKPFSTEVLVNGRKYTFSDNNHVTSTYHGQHDPQGNLKHGDLVCEILDPRDYESILRTSMGYQRYEWPEGTEEAERAKKQAKASQIPNRRNQGGAPVTHADQEEEISETSEPIPPKPKAKPRKKAKRRSAGKARTIRKAAPPPPVTRAAQRPSRDPAAG